MTVGHGFGFGSQFNQPAPSGGGGGGTEIINVTQPVDDGIYYNISSTWALGTGIGWGDPLFVGAKDPGAVRFSGINIPNTATIVSATLDFTVSVAAATASATATLYGQDQDNSASISGNPAGWARTTASVPIPAYTTTGAKTLDVTGVVAEIIARPGWASGNALNLLADPAVGTYGFGENVAVPQLDPTLTITWTP